MTLAKWFTLLLVTPLPSDPIASRSTTCDRPTILALLHNIPADGSHHPHWMGAPDKKEQAVKLAKLGLSLITSSSKQQIRASMCLVPVLSHHRAHDATLGHNLVNIPSGEVNFTSRKDDVHATYAQAASASHKQFWPSDHHRALRRFASVAAAHKTFDTSCWLNLCGAFVARSATAATIVRTSPSRNCSVADAQSILDSACSLKLCDD
eukprot:2626342-Amphidinium_carterae.1